MSGFRDDWLGFSSFSGFTSPSGTLQDVRSFDGVNDVVVTSIGGATAVGDVSVFALVKLDSDSGNRVIVDFGTTSNGFSLGLNGSDALVCRVGGSDISAPTLTLDDSDGWSIIGFTRTTGTSTPRFHKYTFDGGTWAHENASSSAANPSVATGGNYIGENSSSARPCACSVAAVGFFDDDLSDGEAETLDDSLQTWFDLPDLEVLWRLGDATVNDLKGTGADQTSVTGTTVESSLISTTIDLSTTDDVTSLSQLAARDDGTYDFSIGGETWTAEVESNYMLFATGDDSKDGSWTDMAQVSTIEDINGEHKILTSAIATAISSTISRVRLTGTSLDVYTEDATIVGRVGSYQMLGASGANSGGVDDGWTGTGVANMGAGGASPYYATEGLDESVWHSFGNGSGVHWESPESFVRVNHGAGADDIRMWIR